MNRCVFLCAVVSLSVSSALAQGESDSKVAERIAAARPKAEAHLARRSMALGLVDPGKQLREISVTPTALSVIFRYQQYYEEIPVNGAQMTVSVMNTGIDENSALVAPLNVRTSPQLRGPEAERIALRKVGLKGPARDVEASLVIVPARTLGAQIPHGDRLAWKVTIVAVNEQDGLVSRAVFVDAQSGEVLADITEMADLTYYRAEVKLRGMYIVSAWESIVATYDKSLCCIEYHYMQSPCYGTGVPAKTAAGSPDCGSQPGPAGPGAPLATGLGNWVGDAAGRVTTAPKVMRLAGSQYSDATGIGDGTLGSSKAATVAADAYYFMWKAFTYLYYTHHHFGLDRNNGPAVRAVVHHPSSPSSWFGRDHAIVVAAESSTHYDMASYDVIAHELAHGLNDYGPQLQRSSGLESGKIAETTANMFAMLNTGEIAGFDSLPYRIGEQTLKNNSSSADALTYMDDPSRRQGTVVCYSPAVGSLEDHRGAGPGDHMFYLLVYGGTSKCDGTAVDGIGYDAAEKIWYDAFFKLTPTDGYSQLRARFIASATALSPGPTNIVANTTAAFDAVDIP